MSQFLAIAWLLQKALSYSGILFALAGVGVFGWHFIRLNSLAAQGDSGAIPAESWRGLRARQGLLLFAAGVAAVISALILTAILDGRH